MEAECSWETIEKFSGPRELDRFLDWMRNQIAQRIAEEVSVPTNEQVVVGERWFRHLASGARWRLVPADGPLVPGFWPLDA